ncbi:hypothetical protein CDD83_763 [Cordyceps sp. RAO-2017]|nr:hypothetical protein CDD83_763 [Cordyceps sp. RAO-2017]
MSNAARNEARHGTATCDNSLLCRPPPARSAGCAPSSSSGRHQTRGAWTLQPGPMLIERRALPIGFRLGYRMPVRNAPVAGEPSIGHGSHPEVPLCVYIHTTSTSAQVQTCPVLHKSLRRPSATVSESRRHRPAVYTTKPAAPPGPVSRRSSLAKAPSCNEECERAPTLDPTGAGGGGRARLETMASSTSSPEERPPPAGARRGLAGRTPPTLTRRARGPPPKGDPPPCSQ